MTAPGGPRQRLDALVDRYSAYRAQMVAALAAYLTSRWDVTNPYNPRDVARFSEQVAAATTQAQGMVGRATAAYLQVIMEAMGAAAPRKRIPGTPARLRGVPLVEVYQRPLETTRFLESTGVDRDEANSRGLERAHVLAETDLSLAMREMARQTMDSVDTVVGYRRVIRPELSVSGTCGLCIAASQRVYSKKDLLPLHNRCRCIIVPRIRGDVDPGYRMNRDDLEALYRAAGGTEARRLKRVRAQVHEHGELGPVLTMEGHHFTGEREAMERIE